MTQGIATSLERRLAAEPFRCQTLLLAEVECERSGSNYQMTVEGQGDVQVQESSMCSSDLSLLAGGFEQCPKEVRLLQSEVRCADLVGIALSISSQPMFLIEAEINKLVDRSFCS